MRSANLIGTADFNTQRTAPASLGTVNTPGTIGKPPAANAISSFGGTDTRDTRDTTTMAAGTSSFPVGPNPFTTPKSFTLGSTAPTKPLPSIPDLSDPDKLKKQAGSLAAK